MFTGIIQGKAIVKSVSRLANLTQLHLTFPKDTLNNVQKGASIAINGTCLTVTEFDENSAKFDVMAETMRLTNLDQLIAGTTVNFERAAKFGDEIGGHLLSGHIHTTAIINSITKSDNLCTIEFSINEDWIKYIMPKGFIALNGASLTVGENVSRNTFSVHLIPETLSITTFSEVKDGDAINVEIDSQTQTIVNTIERMNLSKS